MKKERCLSSQEGGKEGLNSRGKKAGGKGSCLGCCTAAATFFFSSVKCHDTRGSHIQPSIFINPRNYQLASESRFLYTVQLQQTIRQARYQTNEK